MSRDYFGSEKSRRPRPRSFAGKGDIKERKGAKAIGQKPWGINRTVIIIVVVFLNQREGKP